MEGLAPPLDFCLELELRIEMGESVRSAILFLLKTRMNSFSFLVQEILLAADQFRNPEEIFAKTKSCYQRALLHIIWRGLQGEPIINGLRLLKNEMEIASQVELDTYLAKLPLRALIPLLLLLLPSFLILLFGPLLNLLSEGVFQ